MKQETNTSEKSKSIISKFFSSEQKNESKLSRVIFVTLICLFAGGALIDQGIEYTKINCIKNTCKISPQTLGLFDLKSKTIENVTEVILDTKEESQKNRTVVTTNIVLKNNSNKNISIFSTYSDNNQEQKELAYKELKETIKSQSNISKTYGGITFALPVGLIMFSLGIAVIYLRIKKGNSLIIRYN